VAFYYEVSVTSIDINASSDREAQPEQSFSCPVDVSEVNAMRLGEREQMLKDSLRVFMGRFTDQDGEGSGSLLFRTADHPNSLG